MLRSGAADDLFCRLCAGMDKGIVPHSNASFLFDADNISASAQHDVVLSYAVVFGYSVFPAVKDPAFANFVILEYFCLAFRTLEREHRDLTGLGLFENDNRTSSCLRFVRVHKIYTCVKVREVHLCVALSGPHTLCQSTCAIIK